MVDHHRATVVEEEAAVTVSVLVVEEAVKVVLLVEQMATDAVQEAATSVAPLLANTKLIILNCSHNHLSR